MGLDTTHDCFHGAYSSFMRFRIELAKAAGLPPLDQMQGYRSQYEKPDKPQISWEPYRSDPLTVLLDHSDCDGFIDVEDCLPLAKRLEELADKLPQDAWGHIARDGGYRAVALQFAKGLRRASRKRERVEFR